MNRRNSPSGTGRLLPLGTPRPVRVRVDTREEPEAVLSGNRWTRIEAIRERWRIDDEWWRDPVSREYHVLVLEGGRMITLYLDLTTKRWYLQG